MTPEQEAADLVLIDQACELYGIPKQGTNIQWFIVTAKMNDDGTRWYFGTVDLDEAIAEYEFCVEADKEPEFYKAIVAATPWERYEPGKV